MRSINMIQKKKIRWICLFICLLVSGGILFSQENPGLDGAVNPDVPVVSLPDINDEVTALENQEVAVPSPEIPPLAMPEKAPPLPEEGSLVIPEPAPSAEITLDTQARPALGETFSEAGIGLGLWRGISAYLSLYKPGINPAYSLSFAHNSLDGFAFHDSGDGYSTRKTSVQGRIRGTVKDTSLSLSAAFSDEADGLQGNSEDFYGTDHRYFDVLAGIAAPLGPLNLMVNIQGLSSALSLEKSRTVDSGDTKSHELSAIPYINLAWEHDKLTLGLETDIAFHGLVNDPEGVSNADRTAYHAGGNIYAGYEYSPAFSFGASLGFLNSDTNAVMVPFSVWISSGFGEIAAINVSGGLKAEQHSLALAWKFNPYLDVGPVLKDNSRWYADFSMDTFIIQDLTLRTNLGYSLSFGDSGRLNPIEAAPGSTRGLYTYTFESYQSLISDISLRKWFGPVFLSAGWSAEWLDPPVLLKRHLIYSALEYRDQKERFGATLGFSFSLDETGMDIPWVDVTGFFRITQGIRVIAEFLDIGAAFADTDGRVLWEPYLSTGFQASIKLQFSL